MREEIVNAGLQNELALFDASDPRYPNTLEKDAGITALTAAMPGQDAVLAIEVGMRRVISKELRGRADRIDLVLTQHEDEIRADPIAFIDSLAAMLRYRADAFLARCEVNLGPDPTEEDYDAMAAYQRPRLDALRRLGILAGEPEYPEITMADVLASERAVEIPAPVIQHDDYRLYRFPNGYGASVIDFAGGSQVLVVRFKSENLLDWDYPDIPGLDPYSGFEETPEQVQAWLEKVAALPAAGKTYEPAKTLEREEGTQRIYRFANGLGASVVSWAYGKGSGLLELAVIKFYGPSTEFEDWDVTYETPITSDVIGYLTEEKVQDLLAQIAALPGGES